MDVRITSGLVHDLLKSPVNITYPYTGITVATTSATLSTITGTTLDTTGGVVTGQFTPGNYLSGTGVTPNTYIVRQISGTAGGTGTYEVSVSQTVTSTTISGDGSGPWLYKESPYAAFQINVDGTAGTQTATVVIEVSNDGVHPVATVLGTISLSGTLTASDGFTTIASWKYIRARVTAISGTGATITATMGV